MMRLEAEGWLMAEPESKHGRGGRGDPGRRPPSAPRASQRLPEAKNRWNPPRRRDKVRRHLMRRQAPRPKANGHSAPSGHPINRCRALVLVDGAATRHKLKKDYEKALRDLENSRRQLDQFQATDQPQFTRWLNSHFGALLTELRELSQKVAADEELILQVESEVLFGGGSHARAYKRVMADRENPGAPPPAANGSEPDEAEFGPRPGFESAGDEEDPLDALFEELFGGFGPGERPDKKRGRQARPHPRSATRPTAVPRLKELYRALVRRLHPDSQQEMTPQKTEWWHQAQAAYEAGDADQLEVILTLCEIGDTGTTAHTSASLLQRITAQLKSSLRQIRRQLTERRRDPAWNFSRRADKDLLALQMRRALTEDLQRLRHQWQETQALLAGWKAAAERGKRPPRRKPRTHPQDMEVPF